MKNKKFTYFLLLVVVSLWGYLIYKVYGAINGSTEIIIQKAIVPQQIEDLNYYTIKHRDSLLLDYRDPLYSRGNSVSTAVATTSEPAVTTSPAHVYLPTAVVPETLITYAGFIENESTLKRVAIVNINSKQYMISKGENREGVTVMDIQKTHIRIKHKGESKIIYK